MSRIGRKPIVIPAGVEVKIEVAIDPIKNADANAQLVAENVAGRLQWQSRP